jgi:tripartite ATP-independent transporter DctM subunit
MAESAFYERVGRGFDFTINGLSKVFTPLSRYFSLLGALLTFIMSLIVAADIFMRVFFNSPIAGSLELQQFILALLVFFALPFSSVNRDHVSIDLISPLYSAKTRAVMESIFYLLSAYLFFVICWQNVVRVIVSIEDKEIGVATGLPLFIFVLIVALGSGIVTIVLFIDFLRSQAQLIKTAERPWVGLLLTYVPAVAVMILPFLLKVFSIEMDPLTAGLLGMGFTICIMLLGMQIMFALGLMGYLGLWYVSGNDTAVQIVRMCVFDSVADYFFCVIPFFVMMGFLCFRSGISVSLYEAGRKIFGQLPGGLAIGTVFGCAGFASICGDSMATAGTMGSVSYPEMKKYRYKDSLATSCVAAGGTLGILIPPSMGFIIYGLIAEVSIGKLFVAGIIPGILLAIFFSVIILIRCMIDPTLGPPGPGVSLKEKVFALKDVWPILVLFIIVIGGIYMGVFTPTEGGGIGTIVALLIGLAKRSLSFKDFIRACIESMALTSVIFGILIGVTILGYFITISEIPMRLAGIIVALPLSRWAIFAVILLLYVFLGMVMNIIPMILITLPILFPTIKGLGFDPIWFGVVMVIMMEMGQITPPVGVNVFVIASVAKGVPMSSIFKGVAPFILAMILVIVLLALFPDLALFLPNSMDTLAPIGP